MATSIHFARASLQIQRNQDFLNNNSPDIPSLIFEEMLWEGLYPIVSIILQTQSTEKVIVISTNCLIQMILVSVESNNLQLQLDASVNALMNFTGLFKE